MSTNHSWICKSESTAQSVFNVNDVELHEERGREKQEKGGREREK